MVAAMPAPAAARRRTRTGALVALGGLAATLTTGVGLLAMTALSAPTAAPSPSCAPAGGPASIVLRAAGGGGRVGATEYGGPGDPSSGTVGASGDNLLANPDSYAELGGDTFQTATAMGGLPYMTPLRVTWDGHSAIAYKRDFGLGGGPVDGLARVIDLWWQFAGALDIPYEDGQWSGPVRIARPPASGAGNVLEQSPAPAATPAAPTASGTCGASTPPTGGGVPTTLGPRAQLLPDGAAAAPATAPAAVKGIIAAGNQIVGRPYLYGGGHGLPLDEIAPAYDCSRSVEHLLYGGGLLPSDIDAASGALESFGLPGPGSLGDDLRERRPRVHVRRGAALGHPQRRRARRRRPGIGWHPLIRESAGFVVRHPAGL